MNPTMLDSTSRALLFSRLGSWPAGAIASAEVQSVYPLGGYVLGKAAQGCSVMELAWQRQGEKPFMLL